MYGSYKNNAAEMKSSGFDTVLLWSTKVNAAGSLNYNVAESPLVEHGWYIGNPD